MSKSIALRTALQTILITKASNVYYEEAPDTHPYPYVVYELSELSHDSGRTLIQLEVNVIDHGDSTSVAEALADDIQDALHKLYYIDTSIQFSSYKNQRNTVKEDDKQIIRRRLLFEIHLHELKGE